MPADLLEFEEPVGVLLKEIEALSMLPRTPERERSIESLRKRADEIRVELYANLTPWQRVLVARHPNRPEHARLRRAAVHRLRRAARRPPLRRRSRDRLRLRRLPRQPVAVVGHQKGRDTKQKIFRNFGYARPGGLPQGAARDAAGGEVPPADRRVHRHAGRVPRHRVGGARRRRSDRLQPARDEHARGADRRHRLRRGGQRRRARHRDRRPRADAGVLGLQRDPARGLRGDPVARRQPEGRGGRGAQDHRARICSRSA